MTTSPESETTREDRITRARELLRIWTREDKKINEDVWYHIDRILESELARAYAAECYEAFTYLTQLKNIIREKEVHNLKNTITILTNQPKK